MVLANDKQYKQSSEFCVDNTFYNTFGNLFTLNLAGSSLRPWACFSKLPVITGPVKLFCFPFQTGVSKVLKIIQ